MDDLDFKREKLRRDAQELINYLDEAIAAEDDSDERKRADQLSAIHVTLISIGAEGFVKTALATHDIEQSQEDE